MCAGPSTVSLEDSLKFGIEILRILLRDEALDVSVDLKALAKRTESFSGSDLKREFILVVY